MSEKSKIKIPGSLILVVATIFANFFNFLYNTYLGRTLNASDFGTIGLLGGILYIIQILTGAIGRTLTYKSGFLSGKYGIIIKSYWKIIRKKIMIISVLVSIIWILISPVLAIIFHTENSLPFLIFTPIIPLGLIGAVDSGFLSGNLFFTILGITNLLAALFKFIFAFLFVRFGYGNLAYTSVPLSLFVAFLINWTVILRLKTHANEAKVLESHMDFPRKFFTTAILTNISSIAFLSVDVILAKAYLSPVDAGLYTIISLTGQMVYFFGTLFSQFIVPLISRAEGLGKDSKNMFYKLLGITTISSLFAFIPLGIYGNIIVPLLFGGKVSQISQYLPLYGVAMIFFGIAINIVSYHQLKKQHIFPVLSGILAVIEFIVLLFFHKNISMFVNVVLAMSIVNMICFMFLHFIIQEGKFFLRNVIDLLNLLYPLPKIPKKNNTSKRILIFNWRDTKHINAGGAETYVHEIAKRLVKDGNQVTVFCGNDGHSKRYEIVDEVEVVRRGGFYFVYLWAFLYYALQFRGKYDVIMDCQNGMPFFTPLYVKKPIYCVMHHVHQDIFKEHLAKPFAMFASCMEKNVMPWAYRNIDFIAVSESTKKEMQELGIIGRSINIVYNGVDLVKLIPGEKSKEPTVLYLGRLKAYKSINVLIYAFKKVLQVTPNAKLIIAGYGDEEENLKKLTNELELKDKIEFKGKVTEKEKLNLYQKAWVFVNPSMKEGWGITTIEANACGTPIVASNVPGLRDSVNNPYTGYLVEYGNSNDFAKKITELLNNKTLLNKMSQESVIWSQKFSWNKSSQDLSKIIIKV